MDYMNTGAVILFTAGMFAGCRLPGETDESLLVTNLRFSPAAFDSFKGNTELRYSLAVPSDVSCVIVKRNGAGPDLLVSALSTGIHESKGTHAHTWLGDTEAGLFAPAGEYVGIVRVRDHQFESTVRVFHF